MLDQLPVILQQLPRDRSTMSVEQLDALVHWLAAKPLKELRRRQGIAMTIQNRIGQQNAWNRSDYDHITFRNASFDRDVCSAAIDLQTFGDDGGWRAYLPKLGEVIKNPC